MPYLPETLPLPQPSTDDAGWWEAAREHRLVIQRCTNCGTFRHTPRPVCYNCRSLGFEWAPVAGKGRIFSAINCVHPVHPAVREAVPYNVVLVELPEAGNVRLVGNVVDTPYEQIEIGMPVEAVWEDVGEDVTLLRWKRA
jgi:uncharacterized OB-fold protein